MSDQSLKIDSKFLINIAVYFGFIIFNALIFEFKFDVVGITFFVVSLQLVLLLSFYAVWRLSLVLAYYIFIFIFLNLLPWLHYSVHIPIWRVNLLKDETYYYVNIFIFMSNVIVFIVSRYVERHGYIENYSNSLRCTRSLLSNLILPMLSIVGFSITFILNDFSIENLLFRGVIDEIRVSPIDDSAMLLLLGMGSRMLTFFSYLYAVTQHKKNSFANFIMLLILIITIFPTGVPRYMVGMVYIPLLLIYIPRLRSGSVFSFMLIFSIIILFPFIDQFRNFAGFESVKIIPSIDYFYAAHFDAYENMGAAIEANFITHGMQLLGVALFYVPRVYWQMKPIGSGSQMAEDLGYSFTNISMPYLGEGYVNFGFIGIVAFAFVLAYAMSKIDKYFKRRHKVKGSVDFLDAFYFYLIGGLFFIMRGDLLSSFSYLSSGIFVAFFLYRFIRLMKT